MNFRLRRHFRRIQYLYFIIDPKALWPAVKPKLPGPQLLSFSHNTQDFDRTNDSVVPCDASFALNFKTRFLRAAPLNPQAFLVKLEFQNSQKKKKNTETNAGPEVLCSPSSETLIILYRKPSSLLPCSQELLPLWSCGVKRNYPRTLPSGSSLLPLGSLGAPFASLIPFKSHNIHLYVHYHVSFPKNSFLIIWVNQLVFPHSSPIISCNLQVTSGLEGSSDLSHFTKILPSPPSILTMLSSVEFQGLHLGQNLHHL